MGEEIYFLDVLINVGAVKVTHFIKFDISIIIIYERTPQDYYAKTEKILKLYIKITINIHYNNVLLHKN